MNYKVFYTFALKITLKLSLKSFGVHLKVEKVILLLSHHEIYFYYSD